MVLLAVTVAVLAAAAPQTPVDPQMQVVAEERLDATPYAWQRGGDTWCAWIESLPQEPQHRRSARQFVPWQIVRRRGLGEPEVVLLWTSQAWQMGVRPAHVVIDAAGTVIASDRSGTVFLRFPAGGGPARQFELPYELNKDIERLEPEGVLHAIKQSGQDGTLSWTPLGNPGFGPSITLPPLLAPRSGAHADVVRAGHELVWCSEPDALTALDVATGATRSIAFPEAAAFTLEQAAGGWLFARALGESKQCFYGELRLTDLRTGEVVARPAPRSFAAWGPPGIFTSYMFHDPVGSRHVGLGEPVGIHGTFVPVDATTVAFRSRRNDPWRLLQLGETRPFDPEPIGAAAAVVTAALDRGTALDSTEFAQQLSAAGVARSLAAIELYARVLRSDAGVNAKVSAASLIFAGGDLRARTPLREALAAEPPWGLKVQLAECLASFLARADARVIEAAFPVESLPAGTRHGDTAVRVAETLAIIGDESSVAYLEALVAHAPFDRVHRALTSVRAAPQFRAALAASRQGYR